MAEKKTIRDQCESRLVGLYADRHSYFGHWGELAEYILPRRYQWVVTPNNTARGSSLNRMILDSTGTLAARNLASGMMADITSPTRPWFKFRVPGFETERSKAVDIWLAEVERRVGIVMQESNFYNAMAVVYFDLVVFGSAVMLIYEDFDDVVRCYNPCAGEYYLANSDRLAVDTIYREFVQTVSQLVQWFGYENCSKSVQDSFKRGGSSLTNEILIAHAIEPNTGNFKDMPSTKFAYREVYWEQGSRDERRYLSVRPFYELPGIAPRWDLVSNDAYGRSPAMDALPDIKQLQQETKRKAQAIDKMVNPPLVADVNMKNQPASVLPGAVTYVAGASLSQYGFRAAYQVDPRIQELMLDIAEIQKRIKDTFFNDLFLMISQLDTVRTATEIDARREEKLVMLGPVLERFQNEALDPAVNRVFSIMERAGLLPDPPAEIQGAPIQIQYVSILATAQRASATSAIERLMQVTGNLAALDPAILDAIDDVEELNEYATLLSIPPKIMRAREAVMQIRQQRQLEKQGQEALAAGTSMAEGAKTLSETNLGGGVNALQLMQGGGILGGQ